MNNLNDREKNLLLVLVIIIIGIVYYLYIFTPQSKKIVTLLEERDQKENQVAQYVSKIQNISNFKEKLSTEKKNIVPLAEKFYSDNFNQEDIIVNLNEIADKSGVEITDISFDKPEESDIDIHSTQSSEENSDQGVDFAPQSSTDTDSTSSDNQESASSSDEPNIRLLEANVNLLGTYSKIHEFIRLIEELDKNIVVDETDLSKNDDVPDDMSYAQIVAEIGDPNDYLKVSMLLKIYNVSSLEKYHVEEFKSILADPVIKIRNEDSPFMSYPWGDWWSYVDNVSDNARNSGYVPSQLTPADYYIPPKVKNPMVQTKKPVEITDFNDISTLKPFTENSDNSISVLMENISQLPYKVATATVEFNQNSQLEDKVLLNFNTVNPFLEKKPSEIGMVIYSDTPNAMEVGLVVSDRDSVIHYLPVVNNINNVGKTDAKIQFSDNIPFPVMMTGVYFRRNNLEDMFKAKISLDMIYANYVTVK